jgi:hypothetical protein
MLSHMFHQPQADLAHAAEVLHPPDLLNEVWARVVDPQEVPAELLSEFVDVSAASPGRDWPWRQELVDRALAPDLTYHRAGAVLRAAYDPPFFATYFYGLDVVGHAFLRYAEPDRFGDVRPDEVRRFGRVVDRYASLLDEWVGEFLERANRAIFSSSPGTGWIPSRCGAACSGPSPPRRSEARTRTRPTACCSRSATACGRAPW